MRLLGMSVKEQFALVVHDRAFSEAMPLAHNFPRAARIKDIRDGMAGALA